MLENEYEYHVVTRFPTLILFNIKLEYFRFPISVWINIKYEYVYCYNDLWQVKINLLLYSCRRVQARHQIEDGFKVY